MGYAFGCVWTTWEGEAGGEESYEESMGTTIKKMMIVNKCSKSILIFKTAYVTIRNINNRYGCTEYFVCS